MDVIPVIGTAIVNTPFWVNRLIASVDYPVNEFVVFDNSNDEKTAKELDCISKIPHKFIKKIKVCHLPSNIGCPGAWNLIIKCNLLAPYWIITNHDIQFTPGFLKAMAACANKEEIGIVYGEKNEKGEGKWDIFLIKDWVIQTHGLFDENFYPAYVEDIDYNMRLLNKPVAVDFVNKPYFHGEETYNTTGSQTWRSNPYLKHKIDHSRILNEGVYLVEKWGKNWSKSQPYPTPFNNEYLPLSHTTYNLDFLRQKHLGF